MISGTIKLKPGIHLKRQAIITIDDIHDKLNYVSNGVNDGVVYNAKNGCIYIKWYEKDRWKPRKNSTFLFEDSDKEVVLTITRKFIKKSTIIYQDRCIEFKPSQIINPPSLEADDFSIYTLKTPPYDTRFTSSEKFVKQAISCLVYIWTCDWDFS